MSLRFAKMLAHARPPEKLNVADGGVSIFSAENFSVAYCEVHAYRTGIVLEVPEGSIVLLQETNAMGVAGVTVAGGILTPNDTGEVRVSLINSHRNAYVVKSGDPIAWAMILKAPPDDDDFEEYDLEGLTNEMKEAAAEALKESRKIQAEKKAKAAADAVKK